ncbi:nitrate reductase molybdenum cofactor assembly chaperone NarJ [mine drainage metagenome]|uniref:Nitrate reductase molybdenum cofactor assembly chaperone NarJ n=1 Tax=mine drainage metagenome TaxID=410659 RepID=A0A1J5S1T1_9ZZZZ
MTAKPQDRTLKALSLLLCYPSAELVEALPEIGGVLGAERRLTTLRRGDLARLAEELRGGDLYDLQERYVDLFDRSRSLSLSLFEHVHGEGRDRGGAMLSLLETYREAGFEPTGWELPDHLPLLLEFLSTQPAPAAADILASAAHILEALAVRLERRGSAYAAVLSALVDLAGGAADRAAVSGLLEQPDSDPADLAALDAVWEESEVLFGPDPGAGCPSGRDLLARMDQPQHAASLRSAS